MSDDFRPLNPPRIPGATPIHLLPQAVHRARVAAAADRRAAEFGLEDWASWEEEVSDVL